MPERPVVVVGIAPGCGADVLADRLAAHPALALPPGVPDNHLPRGAGALWDGVRRIADGLSAAADAPGPGHRIEAELAAGVGDALLGWIADAAGLAADQRLLTATHQVDDLPALARLCRGADLVAVVADGRTVVARGMAERGWSFQEGLGRWLHGATQLLNLLGRPLPLGVRLKRVTLEDLVAAPAAELDALVDWLDLDPAPELTGPPLATPEAPGWPRRRRARFAVRAGVHMRALGYEVDELGRGEAAVALAAEVGAKLRHGAGGLLGGS